MAVTVVTQKRLSQDKRSRALSVFIFDALIQNPDRRIDKPNVLEDSKDFYLIDHDLALSFFGGMIVGGPTAVESE